MKAITIEQEGARPAVAGVPTPVPEAGEVLVRVRASSVNPMDGAIAAGMLKGMVEHVYPIALGRDFAGTVEAVGDGVTSVTVGDEVLGAVPGIWPNVHAGAWAEQITAAEGMFVKRPDGLEMAIAGATALAALT